MRNQHILVLVMKILIACLTLVIPYLLIRFASGSFQSYSLIIYCGLLVSYLGYHIYGYMNGMYILTSERIINVDQRGFFSRRITEAELDRIQDVSTHIRGVFPTMFGYGNVIIRTASNENLLVLANVPKAYEMQQAIVAQMKELT